MEHSGSKRSNIHQSLKVANECCVSIQFACNARRRYLTDLLDVVDCRIEFYNNYMAINFDNDWFKKWLTIKNIIKRKKIYDELDQIKRITMPRNEITDEMIQRAKDYPITNLIDFSRGKKATAFCHEDKNPSMYHMTRLNMACCPVCSKTFDTIAVLCERDGMKFADAVNNLCGN